MTRDREDTKEVIGEILEKVSGVLLEKETIEQDEYNELVGLKKKENENQEKNL